MAKTTIAISPISRKKLNELKQRLETVRGHFVDMDEVISFLLEKVHTKD